LWQGHLHLRNERGFRVIDQTFEYIVDVRMLYRVICGCLSAAISAYYPLQHPHIRISADPHFTPGPFHLPRHHMERS